MKLFLFTTITIFYNAILFAQPTAGLVAYWPMNGNFTDAGPNNIIVTNNGATATTDASGTANTAMNFNNPTSAPVQYASHAPNANLNFGATQDFSLDFKIFIPTPFTHTVGLYDNNLNYGGYGLWLWTPSGFPQINFNFKNNSVGTTNGALSFDTWYHICCLRASGTLKVYINGVLNASVAEGPTTPVYNFNGYFGTMFANSVSPKQYNPLMGKLDEFRIYNRALTQAEISNFTVLPIKLLSFTATQKDNDNLLRWQTTNEINVLHFTIQQSTDGINFNNINIINAKGSSTAITNYSYLDNAFLNTTATIYYRLQIVNTDGGIEYSNTIIVKRNDKKENITLIKNPVNDLLQLQLYSNINQQVKLFITDALGRQLVSKEINLQQGQTFTSIPINNFTNGMYFITVVGDNLKQTLPFLKN